MTPAPTTRIRCLTGLVLFAGSLARATASDIAAELHADRVTVYREGAMVTRAGSVAIPAGSHRIIIRGLPAGIDARTLRVAVDSPAVSLGGVEVARINEGTFVSAAERDLRRRIEETSDRRAAVQDEIATAQTQLKLLDSLAASPAGSPTKATVDAANLAAVLTTMSTSASAARRRIREAGLETRALDRELERLKADLGKVATASKQSTELRAALEASAAASPTVTVSYTVADAGWQWIYEARLDTARKRISLERQGQVRQGSGEDWRDVELTLTTALPAGDIATPVVGSEFLDLAVPRPPEALLGGSRVRMMAAPAPAAAPLQEVAVTAAKRSAVVAATEYLAEYRVPARVTVLADREPRLYPIAADAFDVDLVARIVPGASRTAHLEATFKYERDVPIESGELQLYRDGAYVGEAGTKVFLPGADVRMPFGADERIRVAVRDEQAHSSQRGVIGKQIVKETRQRFEITSYHPAPIAVEVVDRVPVSRHADVQVEILKGATEPTTRDLDGKAGVLLWKFAAEPQKTVAIRHYYAVRYPKDRTLSESFEDGDE